MSENKSDCIDCKKASGYPGPLTEKDLRQRWKIVMLLIGAGIGAISNMNFWMTGLNVIGLVACHFYWWVSDLDRKNVWTVVSWMSDSFCIHRVKNEKLDQSDYDWRPILSALPARPEYMTAFRHQRGPQEVAIWPLFPQALVVDDVGHVAQFDAPGWLAVIQDGEIVGIRSLSDSDKMISPNVQFTLRRFEDKSELHEAYRLVKRLPHGPRPEDVIYLGEAHRHFATVTLMHIALTARRRSGALDSPYANAARKRAESALKWLASRDEGIVQIIANNMTSVRAKVVGNDEDLDGFLAGQSAAFAKAIGLGVELGYVEAGDPDPYDETLTEEETQKILEQPYPSD